MRASSGSPAPPPAGGRGRAGWAFAAPALAGLLLFLALPFLLALALSFTNYRMNAPLPTRFVGMENYARLFERGSAFPRALANTLLFAAVVVPLQTALALGLALLLDLPLRLRPLLRSLFFLPVIFPMALVAAVWTLIYAPGPAGLLNAALAALPGGWEARDWLHEPGSALPAIIALSIWQGLGFQTVILLAGLQQIPGELNQAASIDGAGRWARFRHVTLPLLRGPLLFTALVTTILAFRLFDQVHIMTRGGPEGRTTTIMYEAWRAAFVRQSIGSAAAMTVLFFLLVLGVVALQRLLARRGERA